MSDENKKIKPKTDIELFLNNANQCIWKKLNNDSGAGANAASRVDMIFAATDPLSEIVYSPDKGLRLKCADSSFADKSSSSLFRDVGTSCMVLPPSQDFTGTSSTTRKPIDDDFGKPIAVVCAKSDTAEAEAPTMHPTGDSGVEAECKAYEKDDIGSVGSKEKVNTAATTPNFPNDQIMNNWEKVTGGDQANIGTDKISGIEGNKFSAISGQAQQGPLHDFLLQSHENKPSMDDQNPSPGRHSDGGVDIGLGKKAIVTDDDLHIAIEPIIEYKSSGAPGTNLASSSRSHLEKQEHSAENYLRTFNYETACAGASGVNVNQTEKKNQDNQMRLPCDKILPVLESPCHSRIHMAINKGEEKSLSDEDANAVLSREENDSHSSVESCNSSGFFSTGKKRRNFQQQLKIESKRFKQQTEETSGSKSNVKQDSSFMNWISNMVKGLSQSVQNDSNTLALSLANPDHHNLLPDEKLITCNMNQDPEPKNTGFKSIFQSIYCPSLKNVGTRMSHQGESNEDLEPGNMEHGIDATPITCCAENNSISKLCFQSNKSEASTGGYDVGPSSQPKIKPQKNINFQESSKNILVENKSRSILGHSKDKEKVASHSSSTKQNTDDNDNIDSKVLSGRKEEENIFHRRDNLGSLWITRLSPKFTASLREQPANDSEASTDLKEDKGNNDHKSKYKFKPLSSSPGFRNLDPMASMFARRFGAVKHIIPTDAADNATTQLNMLCLFCGTRGHQLSDCSAIVESKLEDLQKNIDSYGRGLEEHPCLCIKCFQPNHWAISCPYSISTRKHELKANALADDCGKHLILSNEESVRLLTDDDHRVLSGGSINDETDNQAGQNINLKGKSNEILTFKVGCTASFKKYCGSSSEENKFRENPTSSPSKLAERQISDMPKEIFDAVKKLRLSRTDILKWINTHGSISQLDGFFLRLRLGNWEEGMGGTGYHVACINESQSTRKCLSVKVGSIKCMVESQYISNHDFLEEEIMEWWSNTSQAGSETPSEEDLIEKLKRKRNLGL